MTPRLCIFRILIRALLNIIEVEAWATAFTPDMHMVASGTHAGLINLWNVESGVKEKPWDSRGRFVMSLAFVRGFHPFSLGFLFFIFYFFGVVVVLAGCGY